MTVNALVRELGRVTGLPVDAAAGITLRVGRTRSELTVWVWVPERERAVDVARGSMGVVRSQLSTLVAKPDRVLRIVDSLRR